ncbi:peptidylprolyl isomerase [Cohnella luojiensis]|uniref:Peptidylprolyl isomerase n=1 Tax=Cohnella luojiensis TaxID=652876 RepID=A0A4Y8LS45_9BACL|nr:peptidylprolyl isomerase [Cohnella luojiensis]TFE24136.1 peptidylprolyl isomerase [Cohnella luojiensis]
MLHHNRMPYRRLAMLTLAAVMLVALISACGKKEEASGSKGTVIATYKGGEVIDKEFDKYTAFQTIMNPQSAMYMSIPQFKEQFIKQYIVSKVLLKDISDEDKKAADTAADSFKKQLEEARNTQPELKKHMDDSDLSVKEAVAMYHDLAAFQSYYAAKGEELKPTVKEEEIKAEYDKAPSDFNIVSVRHILIGTTDPETGAELKSDEDALNLAKEVKTKLEAGGDWNALAKEYSTDTGSKDKGGLYEKQQAKAWVAEFKDAANKQEIGKVGDPVQTQFGYHVMKVESREATPYDKLKTEDKDGLKSAVAQTKLSEFLTAEEGKLEIKVTLPAEPTPTATGSPDASPTASAPAK